MKKTTTLFFTMLVAFCTFNVYAGDGSDSRNGSIVLKKGKGESNGVKGKMMLTVGFGFNSTPIATLVRYQASSYFLDSAHGTGYNMANRSSSFAPLYNIVFDYGISSRFSVGAGLGYQTFSVFWGDNSGGNFYNYTDKWTRLAFSLRGDFHILTRKHFSMYTGIRLSYNTYSMTSNVDTRMFPNYTTNLDVKPQTIGFQAHFGIAYFITENIGINVEVGPAVGGPYYAALGVKFKF